MTDYILFDDRRFISAQTAADASRLTRDHITRLCRTGKVRGKTIGKTWYVDESSLKEFLQLEEALERRNSEALRQERINEYQVFNRDGADSTSSELPRGETDWERPLAALEVWDADLRKLFSLPLPHAVSVFVISAFCSFVVAGSAYAFVDTQRFHEFARNVVLEFRTGTAELST